MNLGAPRRKRVGEGAAYSTCPRPGCGWTPRWPARWPIRGTRSARRCWTWSRNSGGTSASAPIWAGLIALADQVAHRHLGFVNPALYRIAASPAYHLAFHDITSGNNTAKFPPKTFTGYRAAPGWDPVTGLGSPDASSLSRCWPGSPSTNPPCLTPSTWRRPAPHGGPSLAGGNCRWLWLGSN